jgi:hypothetical protein
MEKKFSEARSLEILFKLTVLEIKFSSGKNVSQSLSKMVKKFATDAEMTQLLPFKYINEYNRYPELFDIRTQICPYIVILRISDVDCMDI